MHEPFLFQYLKLMETFLSLLFLFYFNVVPLLSELIDFLCTLFGQLDPL